VTDPVGVLVLNCGSSSLKCQRFEMPAGKSTLKAMVERVGQPMGRLQFELDGASPEVVEAPFPNHLAGIRAVLDRLQDAGGDGLSNQQSIGIVGHRVVHAGEAYSGSVPVTDEVLSALEACSDLAPLHNPPNLAGIRACLEAMPGIPQVCVFDNAIHHTLGPERYLYGLPRRYYDQHRVRRYGFHGVAIRSILAQFEQLTGVDPAELRVLCLMLGSGCTACGMKFGESVAVSTGFTPLEGLVQSTRCGDLDPGVVLALLRSGQTPGELNTWFNRSCGLAGLSGVSADMRDIEQAGTAQAQASLDLFVHRLKKTAGAYVATMGGVDAIAFGGGIGQNSPETRAALAAAFGHLGARLDDDANQACVRGRDGIVSSSESAITIAVTMVDEERVIAGDSYAVATRM